METAYKRPYPLAIDTGLTPDYIGKTLWALTKLRNILDLHDILRELPYGPYMPNRAQDVFAFLLDTFKHNLPPVTERRKQHAQEIVIEQLEHLDAADYGLQEIEYKIAEMLALNYIYDEDAGTCVYEIRKPCRPLTNRDGKLLLQALNEAIPLLLRSVNYRAVIDVVKSDETIVYERFEELIPLYRRLSIAIDALSSITSWAITANGKGDIARNLDYVWKYSVAYDHHTFDQTGQHLFRALDYSYAKVIDSCECSDYVPRHPNFEWIISPKNKRLLKSLGFNANTLEFDIAVELELSGQANVVRDAEKLRDVLRALQMPILRLAARVYGEEIAEKILEYYSSRD